MRLATSGLMIITFILLKSCSIVSTIFLRLLSVGRGGEQKGSKRWKNNFARRGYLMRAGECTGPDFASA
jgi:hypothetical protein